MRVIRSRRPGLSWIAALPLLLPALLVPLAGARAQQAEGDAAALAQQLANPIADLISVPLQSNFDFGLGPDDDGFRYTLNVQPVIPIDLGEDWIVISRTIFPLIAQNDDVTPLSDDAEFATGDTLQSFFFSPRTGSKLTWGVGPVIVLPTASEDFTGLGQLGLGPTGVALVVDGPWTYGLLVNHVWGVADAGRADVQPDLNSTFLQPFGAWSPGDGWTFTLQTETSYDWEGEQWSVPLAAFASKVVRLGDQTLNLQAGPRVYAEAPPGGPQWGLRANVTLVFPK